jgi:hypothetical protein
VLGDARTLARELDVDADVPWLQALRTVSVERRLDDDEIDARAHVRTDPDGLSEAEFAVPGVVFGMIADRFVVARTLGEARRVADMDVSDVDGARGAAVMRTGLGSWASDQLERAFGVKTLPMREVTGDLRATLDGIEGRLRVEIPDGLD